MRIRQLSVVGHISKIPAAAACALIFLLIPLWVHAAEAPEEDEPTVSSRYRPVSVGLDLQYGYLTYGSYAAGAGAAAPGASNAFHLGLEWIPIRAYGKLSLGGGAGFTMVKGIDAGGGTTADLYTFPIDVTLAYRFEYFADQFLVPFAAIGVNMTILSQNGGSASSGLYQGLVFGGGIEFCLNNLDQASAKSFALHIGVQKTYLLLEYVSSSPLSAGTSPNLSFTEYRAGLRFEI